MKVRPLGESGMLVSEISFGCMSLPPSKKEASRIIDNAIDFGINYFDTADLYDRGKNEEIIGHALKPVREQVFLATKVGNRWEDGKDGWVWDSSRNYIKQEVKESLRRLQTDYIDLYQLHGGTMEDDLEDVIDVFEELQKDGLIRHYGISSIRPNVIKRFLKNGHPSSIMMQYSLLDRRPEEWLHEVQDAGAGIVCRGSLAKGLLTDEWDSRITDKGYLTYSERELKETLTLLNKEASPLHSTAIHYVLSKPAVSSCVIGASSVQQLRETMKAYEQEVPEAILSKAAELTKSDQYSEHRD